MPTTTTRPVLNVHTSRMVATPGALAALEAAGVMPGSILLRHLHGDWGDCDAEDAKANDAAVKSGARTLGVYKLSTGKTVWAIADASMSGKPGGERYALTLLLPEDY